MPSMVSANNVIIDVQKTDSGSLVLKATDGGNEGGSLAIHEEDHLAFAEYITSLNLSMNAWIRDGGESITKAAELRAYATQATINPVEAIGGAMLALPAETDIALPELRDLVIAPHQDRAQIEQYMNTNAQHFIEFFNAESKKIIAALPRNTIISLP